MNDFETRARAAGRAIHDAVDDATPVTAAPHKKSRGPIRALAIAAVVTLIAVVGTTLVVNNRSDAPADEVSEFCAEIDASATNPDTTARSANGEVQTDGSSPSLEYLRNAPPEIRETALEIRHAHDAKRNEAPGTLQKFLNWYQLRCFPDAAQPEAPPSQQRYAPAPERGEFHVCGVSNRPPAADAFDKANPRDGHITIFGDTAIRDPYRAPMIGLASSSEGGFRDDDTARPVVLATHPDAVISDITGAFGARIDNGGLVISWREGKQTIGVFGRGYGPERESELIALANQVTIDDSGPHLPSAELPRGYATIFSGPLDALNTLGTAEPAFTYTVIADKGELQLSAAVRGRAESEAIRFLATGLTPTTISGKRILAGPWSSSQRSAADGPALLRWTEPDGVSLTLLSLAHRPDLTPTLDRLKAVAGSTRRLNRSDWESLINGSNGCFGDLIGARSSAAPGTAQSSATSSTSVNPTNGHDGGTSGPTATAP